MVSRKQKIKQKFDGQVNELENLLGVMLAPVAPRGEFVNQLQKRLESRFDPQPLLLIPSKFLNLLVIGMAGLFGGIVLTIFGIKWFKRKMRSKLIMREIQPNNENRSESQLPEMC